MGSRTPQGVRGLKFETGKRGLLCMQGSHPARGAWIEIGYHFRALSPAESHPARGAWIEMGHQLYASGSEESHPARGAWIEMTLRL